MPDWTVEVDLSDLDEAIRAATNPDLGALADGINRAASYIRDVWGRAVQGEVLPGMRGPVVNDEYYESLYTGDSLQLYTPLHGAVISTYAEIERIERGYPSWDMKPGLLAGPSSRVGRHGRYNVIPFRHMTPQKGTSGHTEGDRRAHGSVMPQEVYRVVKRSGKFKDPGRADLGEQIGQRSKIPATVNLQAVARGMVGPMTGGYTWKYGLYHNMRRIVKQYDHATQATYWTWRTVSEASDPNSWIHPGRPPNPVIEAVINFTRPTVEEIIHEAARAAFGAA